MALLFVSGLYAARMGAALVPELDARIQAHGPVARGTEGHDGTHLVGVGKWRATVRNKVGIERLIDLVAGTHDAAPVQEVIADKEADVVGEIVADLDAELGDHAEAGLGMMADVGGQSIQA